MPEEDFKQKKQPQEGPSEGPRFSGAPIKVGMPWRLMVFSFVLFAFSILVFLGLRFGYDVYLNSQLEALDEKVEQLSTEVSEGRQEEFLGFYSQLSNLERVLGRRGFSHNVFGFLEENTLPPVYYSEAEYSSDTKGVRLTGAARTMKALVEQMAVFGDASSISGVTLDSVSMFGGRVGFEISLVFSPSYFDEPR